MKEIWESSWPRKAMFTGIIGGSSIAIAPMMKALIAINPTIIPVAAASALWVMAGSTLYAFKRP